MSLGGGGGVTQMIPGAVAQQAQGLVQGAAGTGDMPTAPPPPPMYASGTQTKPKRQSATPTFLGSQMTPQMNPAQGKTLLGQ